MHKTVHDFLQMIHWRGCMCGSVRWTPCPVWRCAPPTGGHGHCSPGYRMSSYPCTPHSCSLDRAWKRSNLRFVITKKAPTKAFSWLKAPTSPSRGLLRDCENGLWNRWIVCSWTHEWEAARRGRAVLTVLCAAPRSAWPRHLAAPCYLLSSTQATCGTCNQCSDKRFIKGGTKCSTIENSPMNDHSNSNGHK